MRQIFFTLIAGSLLLAASPAVAEESQDSTEEAQALDEEDEAPDEETVLPGELAVEDEEADDEVGDEIADEPSVTTAHPSLAVGPHLGVTAPQLFGDLGSWPVFGADVGYILPFDVAGFERPLQIGLDVTYTRPGATGEGTHPMLGEEGDTYEWELQQQMLTLQMTTMWRFKAPGQGLSFHGLIGPRIYLMESVMEANRGDGADFGENRETNTEYGVVFGGGAEYALGPGSLVGTLQVGGSPLDQRITGEANTGSFYLDVGYRLFF